MSAWDGVRAAGQAPLAGHGAGEAMLRDAMAREARAPRGRVAVLARLSLLPPPGPRAHHRRVVRALMQDCAQLHGGQVLVLRSGDLVLLADGPLSEGSGPGALPGLLARLLQVDGLAGEAVMEEVALAGGAARLEAVLGAAPEDGAVPAPVPPLPAARSALPAIGDAALAGLLQVATAARLAALGGPALGGAAGLQPVHRAASVAPHLLARVPEAATLAADPWLRHHLDAALDAGLLRLVARARGGAGALDPRPRAGVAPLLLRLGPQAVLSPGFAEVAGPGVRVAMAAAVAVALPASFVAARARLAAEGMGLVLDLDHNALVAARPEALGADWLRFAWAPGLARLPQGSRAALAAAVARIGAGRVVMAGAEDEASIRWGRGIGLAQFEGRHVEAMLAATRLLACPHAAGCGLRACAGRAMAAQPAGRVGCADPALLDRAVPANAARVAA
jgi:hypothetical protein